MNYVQHNLHTSAGQSGDDDPLTSSVFDARLAVGLLMSVAVQIEAALDRLALVMERAGKRGDVYLPIYERLEEELAVVQAKDARMQRARSRLKQSSGRTGTRFSAFPPDTA
jgi:hypothetical protein